MKRCILFLLLFLLFSADTAAFARENGEGELGLLLETELEKLDLSPFTSRFQELPPSLRRALSLNSFRELFLAENRKGLDETLLIEEGKSFLLGLLPELFREFAALPLFALLSALLRALLREGEVQKLMGLFCHGLALERLLSLFSFLFGEAKRVITALSDLAEASVPLLSTLLTAVGGNLSGELLGRSMQFLGASMLLLFKNWILPVLALCAGTGMLGPIVRRQGLAYMNRFLRQLCKWSLGLSASLYVGSMAIHGLLGRGMDSLMFRTAKFTLDHSLPVVGGAVSGTADIAWACAMLLKNGAGLCFTLLILGYAASPLLRIALTGLFLRLGAGICALFSAEELPRMLGECASVLELLCAVLFVSAFLMLLLAAQITGLGGGF